MLYDLVDEASGTTYGPYNFTPDDVAEVPNVRFAVLRHVCDDILADGSCGHLAPTIPGIF